MNAIGLGAGNSPWLPDLEYCQSYAYEMSVEMGMFSRFKESWKKSSGVRKLKQAIASISFDSNKEEGET